MKRWIHFIYNYRLMEQLAQSHFKWVLWLCSVIFKFLLIPQCFKKPHLWRVWLEIKTLCLFCFALYSRLLHTMTRICPGTFWSSYFFLWRCAILKCSLPAEVRWESGTCNEERSANWFPSHINVFEMHNCWTTEFSGQL